MYLEPPTCFRVYCVVVFFVALKLLSFSLSYLLTARNGVTSAKHHRTFSSYILPRRRQIIELFRQFPEGTFDHVVAIVSLTPENTCDHVIVVFRCHVLSRTRIETEYSVTAAFSCGLALATSLSEALCSVTYLSIPFAIRTQEAVRSRIRDSTRISMLYRSSW